jgi:lantibiotic modifying enzyme
VAGIADALLDLYDAARQTRYRDIAIQAGWWIMAHGIKALDDGSGVNWPVQPGGDRTMAFWCHGAAGIGRFLLHLGEVTGLPEASRFAVEAARTIAHGIRWAGPTQCHGLAGNIEFLLDMYQVTGDAQHLADTRLLGRLLLAFAAERDGLLMYPSESSRVFTPDYMVGFAGVAVALLRLADPLHRPHQLSRKGFRYRSPHFPAGNGTAGDPYEMEVRTGTLA